MPSSELELPQRQLLTQWFEAPTSAISPSFIFPYSYGSGLREKN